MFAEKEYLARTVSTGENYAYLKIGEGCSNMCTYCAIPYIRGLFISRKMEEILEEAKMLANKGVKEIIVIAQDTTKYGVDLYGESKLAELLQKISEIKGIEWIRFLYSYPEGITDELIDTVKNNDKICKYFDIPIQHISNDVLKRMNRKYTTSEFEEIVQRLRKYYNDVILTTDIIVGFPGETEEDFETTYNYLKKINFYKMHVFPYSPRKGTVAAKMPDQIQGDVKERRSKKLIELSNENQKQYNQNLIGKDVEVLFEEKNKEGYYKGHTQNYILVEYKTDEELENKIVKVNIKKAEVEYVIG